MENKKLAGSVPATQLTNKKNKWKILGKQKALIFMSVPFVLYIILFRYIPLWGWTMAFQNYKPAKSFLAQTWVGFKWFFELFKSPEFLLSLRNTVGMSLISTALGYITAILIAVFLNEVRIVGIKRFVQTVSYLPHFLSWIIVCGLVANVLNVEDGVLNNILLTSGFIKQPVQWLSVPKYFWHIIGWTYVWKEVGWNTIVYLGAMTAIDPCLYEAAQIDGCGRLRKIMHITLPGIKPTIVIMMIMSAGHILDANFEMPYLLQNGMIQDVAETIDIYVLKYGFKLFNFSLATAAGIFKNAVNIMLLLVANGIAKRSGEERLI
ncbi:sugar ABC transporter permease [Treponema sp. Marseille-Q3903]|uniref:ABC transporter permease n=1 Tax=Treponema sp. Marseille-Q3903 TaxID=2766703 RepID=UPI001652085B|nr:ABC transporter permease subunit [Treponema sp. Marseille-Q3903]MBC6713140.1 sugar ABC transporter permease [Treponema sp. Marseille-Q3903]